ncbi:MAG: tryptophan--tRNA ligase [Pirellulales bacterium]
MRVLSEFNPQGVFTGGITLVQFANTYFQDQAEAFFFIANLHALTTVRDRDVLRQNTIDAALDLLALGVNPEKATLFVQSDVPEVSELYWLLMSGTPMGLLERCVAFKEKKDRGISADAGLFSYPVLQAADILAYDADTVPVGADQVQHIEVFRRNIAGSFNHSFGEVFVMPKAKIVEATAKVPGLDGEKMSKSYNNTIEVFEPVKQMRKKVECIATDSRPMEQAKEPDGDHLFYFYSLLLASDSEREEMALPIVAAGLDTGR